MDLGPYINNLLSSGLSHNTVIAYQRDLTKAAIRLDLAQASLQDVQEWLGEQIDAGTDPVTVRRMASSMRSFLRFTGHHKIANQIESPRLPQRLPQVCTHEECVNLIYSAAKIRDQAILELLYGSGLRATELCTLRVTDVDLEAHAAHVHGKGGRDRMVPISVYAVGAIGAWRKVRPAGDALFLTHGDRPMSRTDVFKVVRAAGKRAGIKLHPHTLRHSCATRLLVKGMDIRYIAEILGHSDPETTARYCHLDVGRLKKVQGMLGR